MEGYYFGGESTIWSGHLISIRYLRGEESPLAYMEKQHAMELTTVALVDAENY